jgi:hypothetical protein
MKPLRTPADGALAAKDYLATALPPLTSGTDPTVGLNLPDDWTPASAPRVVVFDDGGPEFWPVATAPRLRITVWSNSRTTSRSIAGLAMGILLSHRIPRLSTVTDPTSILDARDSNNRGLMASFTVATTVRTNAA